MWAKDSFLLTKPQSIGYATTSWKWQGRKELEHTKVVFLMYVHLLCGEENSTSFGVKSDVGTGETVHSVI